MLMNKLFNISICKAVLLFLVFCACICSASAQENSVKKPKVFHASIKLTDGTVTPKSILYEVGDSSIFLKRWARDTVLTEYKYYKIKKVKIGRPLATAYGAGIGATAGAIGGLIAVNTVPGGLEYMTVPISALSMIYFGFIFGGVGAISCSIKDRIPVNGSYENFEKYQSCFLDYSYLKEGFEAKHRFEHNMLVNVSVGFSFSGGEFASDIPVSGYTEMDSKGAALKLIVLYRFTKYFGVSLSHAEDYYVVKNTERSLNWSYADLEAGPYVSIPLSKKVRFEFTSGLGIAGTTLANEEDFLLNGSGFGWHLGGGFAFDYSKRWSSVLDLNYKSATLKYKEGGNGNANITDIVFGLSYKFGKKSL
jgi:hypothetical protein